MQRISDLMLTAALVLSALIAAPALAQAVDSHEHRFRDAEKWARIFDDPARDEWQKPDEVIQALKLAPDATVADVGSGTGYFAARLARALPRGTVIGVDTEPDMVRYLTERAARENLANLSARLGRPEDPRLPRPVDLVILVNTYHHVPAREHYFRDLRKWLTSGGRITVIDFKPDSPVGPPRRARIPASRVKQELKRAGYELAQEHEFLPYQYFLVFQPGSRDGGTK